MMSEGSVGLFVKVGPDQAGMTARGLLRRAQGVSQRLIRKIIHGEGEEAGALYINGKPATFRDRVKEGDEVHLVFPKERSWIEPQEIPLAVLYEDSDIIVVDKQPGIIVHPTRGHRENTIANAIIFHMQERGEDYKPRFISRLDMGTSGIMLIGKNSHAQDSLSKQNAGGAMEKIYTAVLEGRLEDGLPSRGVIDLPIGLAKPDEPYRSVIPEEEGGHPSKTAYEVTDRLEGPMTVVRAKLITGRTHQIRVHFAHYGFPVVGDTLYGKESTLIGRQALHSTEISFSHPATDEKLHFTAPLPEDMLRAFY